MVLSWARVQYIKFHRHDVTSTLFFSFCLVYIIVLIDYHCQIMYLMLLVLLALFFCHEHRPILVSVIEKGSAHIVHYCSCFIAVILLHS